MRNFSIDEILQAYQQKGYPISQGNKKIMLAGVRSSDQTPNIFNDAMIWIKWVDGAAKLKQADITTDPGLYYLLHPCNVNGTGILKPGYYPDLWRLGLHKGQYEALVQANPCTLIRDFNRDNVLDYDSSREETGMFGINCHHAGENSAQVDNWSAGCNVFKRLAEWNIFIADCKGSVNQYFSYGLFLEEEI